MGKNLIRSLLNFGRSDPKNLELSNDKKFIVYSYINKCSNFADKIRLISAVRETIELTVTD